MSQGFLSLSGISALVVDDNQAMRSLLTLLLKRLGVSSVIQAESGKEALGKLMAGEAPDLLFIDYRLEDIDGISLTRMIRTSDESPNPFVPILMISGFAEPDIVFSARDAGVNEFLAKPVSISSITHRLMLLIDKARPFVRSPSFFGPDRRRRKTPPPGSPRRRKSDAVEDDELEIAS